MIAQRFRQLNVFCRHLYFMKTGHEINCCVFKSGERIIIMLKESSLTKQSINKTCSKIMHKIRSPLHCFIIVF